MTIEPLEARIAPATLLNNVVTYLDVDGDLVTVKTSLGTFKLATPNGGGATDTFTFSTPDGWGQQQLQLIDLHNGGFDGANLTVTVVKKPLGDGLANVGYINATGHTLGTVTVPGDLGQIDAGAGLVSDFGIKALTVHSMGLYGLATQAPGGSLHSEITRAVGTISVATDVKDARIDIDFGGAITKPVTSLTIGGSLIGGAASGSGSFLSDAGFGLLKIGGNIIGGEGQTSGAILTGSTGTPHVGAVTVGGSIIGGPGMFSGSVTCSGGDLGVVKIGGNLRAGSGDQSGKIKAKTTITSVTVGGSVLGGIGLEKETTLGGQIFAEGKIGSVTIAHDVSGGTGDFSGAIASLGNLGPVTIGGSLLGGGNAAGSVFSHATVTSVKIAHDVVGGVGTDSGEIEGDNTTLTIGGSLIGGSGSYAGRVNLTLGTVTIGHDVIGGSGQFSGSINGGTLQAVTLGGSLLGGSVSDTGEITAGNLGSVKIGRDLVGGSIGSGAVNNDLQDSGHIRATSHIGSVTIGGSMIAGIDDNANRSLVGAMIGAGADLGSLTVTGSIIGNHTGAGVSYVTIIAHGAVSPTLTTNVAIGKISVGRRVELAHILAGYGEGMTGSLSGDNPDAQVGPVTVGGDWIASSLAAGSQNSAGITHLGDANDAKITTVTDVADRIARIASIAVGGRVFGTTVASATEHFGFVAEQIGSFKAGGFAFTMKTGSGNDGTTIGRLPNMKIHEVGAFIDSLILVEPARLLNASTVTYTDGDGDHVTVKLTKPLLTAMNVNSVFKFNIGTVGDNAGSNRTLQLIDLTVLATPGLGVTVSAVRGPGPTAPSHGKNFADGVADVGFIDAHGLDVGAISISGDLGAMVAGSGGAHTTAVASLKVRTFGRYGTTTEPAASGSFTPTQVSTLDGALGSLTVTADLKDAFVQLNDTNGDNAKLGAVSIGGSMVGTTVSAENGIASVRIAGDLTGGAASNYGSISSIGGPIGAVTIGGSVLGGIGGYNGAISAVSGTLGAVKIGGNLVSGLGGNDGRIFANLKITSVTVGGSLIGGTGTGAEIQGLTDVGTVSVAHNILGGSGGNSGYVTSGAAMGAVTVGGSLIGRNGNISAAIFSGGDAAAIKIGHDVLGGTVQDSGKIETGGRGASVTVSGSLIGGTAVRTGAILGDSGLGPVLISHDVVGGTAVKTGSITTVNAAGKPATAVTIGGSLLGGSGGNSFNSSGEIRSSGDLGAIVIGRDFLGASIKGTDVDVTGSGIIQATAGRIASVTVSGSIISGLDTSTSGKLISNATIRANDDLGSLTVRGSIVGRESANGGTPVVITARAQRTATETTDLTIGSITVGGLVSLANIEAGFGVTGSASNANAQIGAVKVTGNWLASNLVAGIENYGADQSAGGTDNNVNFADTNDHVIGNLAGSIAKIASITIGGIVAGSPAAGRHFGFSSHLIGAFKTAGFTALLHATTPLDIVDLSPTTSDVTLRET